MVFDASAVLAVVNGEPGADVAMAQMATGGAIISSVNFAEVMTKVYERGTTEAAAGQLWRKLSIAVEPVTEELALDAARLRAVTRSLGLSLGDRCCLALARHLDLPLITADRAWKSLKGFRVTLIR